MEVHVQYYCTCSITALCCCCVCVTVSDTLRSHKSRASSTVDGNSCAAFRVDICLRGNKTRHHPNNLTQHTPKRTSITKTFVHLTALTTRGMVTTDDTYAVIRASRIAKWLDCNKQMYTSTCIMYQVNVVTCTSLKGFVCAKAV